MRATRVIAAILFALVTGVTALACFRGGAPRMPVAPVTHDTARHFDADLFYRGVTRHEARNAASLRGRIRGAVIPHHYVGAEYVAEVFALLAPQQPKTVILLGPNHDEVGPYPVLTSEAAWATPFGTVQPDDAARAAFVAAGAAYDEHALSADHAVAGLIPFVAKYLPNARVVPLLIKRHPDQASADALATALAAAAGDADAVIIGSIDFSHYLTVADADKRDALTLAAMRTRDFPALAAFDNGHLDSPSTATAVLRAMDAIGAGEFTVLAHENSGRILKDPYGSTTSYFTLVWSASAE